MNCRISISFYLTKGPINRVILTVLNLVSYFSKGLRESRATSFGFLPLMDLYFVFDMVLRCGLDPMRKPWPGIYQCVADPNYIMKDRLNIASVCHPAPMNMAELIRAADYVVSRHPDLTWQEDVVEKVAMQMLQEGATRDKDIANAVYADLIANGVRPAHAKWTLRDSLDRAVIRRAKAMKDATFLS
jgi:hypothetical protein